MQKPWFKAKRYGWGWTPITWQGWVIMIIWILINLKAFILMDVKSHSGSDILISFAPIFIITTIIFLIICYRKGEKPGWRWGK